MSDRTTNLIETLRQQLVLQTPAAFEAIVRLLLSPGIPADRLAAEVLPVVEEGLHSWPESVQRVIRQPLRDAAIATKADLPLHRLTHPLDLGLVPFELDAYVAAAVRVAEERGFEPDGLHHFTPYQTEDWPIVGWCELGDDGFDAQSYAATVIGDCLRVTHGIEPRALVLTPETFRELFDGAAVPFSDLESPLVFHHGDLHIEGDLDLGWLDGVALTVTGRLVVDGVLDLRRSEVLLDVGGPVRGHALRSRWARVLFEHSVKASVVHLGDNGRDWENVVNQIDGDLVIIDDVHHCRARGRLVFHGDPPANLAEVLSDACLADLSAASDPDQWVRTVLIDRVLAGDAAIWKTAVPHLQSIDPTTETP